MIELILGGFVVYVTVRNLMHAEQAPHGKKISTFLFGKDVYDELFDEHHQYLKEQLGKEDDDYDRR
ncbi:hypothetical protein N9P17_02585 [Tateyamaria sp.]|nr:hypothetical protein [Tateyamaria sp.]